MELAVDKYINFLDISISNKKSIPEIAIYRKPTATDVIIPFDSNHPPQHKMAGIRFLFNRLNTYPLTSAQMVKERDIINQILANNRFPPNVGDKFFKVEKKAGKVNHEKMQVACCETENMTQTPIKKKTVTFTYMGRETHLVTKLFNNTCVRIAYKTSNTIGRALQTTKPPDNKNHNNYYNRSGIYQLTCPDCNKKYVGQTGRSFHKRFQEHLRDYKYNLGSSKFAQHVTQNAHSFGPIDEIMEVLHLTSKGAVMNTLEKFHIYRLTKKGVQINDKSTSTQNILFDTLLRNDEYRGHPGGLRHQTTATGSPSALSINISSGRTT
jgi:transposase-like protein